MIRLYLRHLINRHNSIEILNNDNNNNNNNNNNNTDTDCWEWKIILGMYIKCISTKSFIETRTTHPKSRQVEIYMGSDTENVISTLQLFNFYKKRQMKEEANLFLIVLNY